MKSDKEHKPLSSEELLRLLDEKSNNQIHSAQELDDFEQEALEGFEEHVDSNRAKALLSEIDVAISQKVAQPNVPAKKRGIVWFSAAASIVLIIVVSVFVLNKTKNEVNSNIALNEKQESEAVKLAEEKTINDISNAESTSDANIQQDHTDIYKEQTNAVESKRTLSELKFKTEKNVTSSTMETEVAAGGALVNQNKDFDNNSDMAKNEVAALETDEKPVAVTGNVTVTDNSVSGAYNKEMMEQDMKVKAEESTTRNTDNVALNSKKKAELDKSTAEKSAAKKDHVAVTTVMAPASSVANAPTSIATFAYYNGGVKAIKEFVLTYITESKNATQLKGKFYVVAYVTENGHLQVLKIDNTSKNCIECVKSLTDALNAMNNWVPAKQDEKAIKTKTEFVLEF